MNKNYRMTANRPRRIACVASFGALLLLTLAACAEVTSTSTPGVALTPSVSAFITRDTPAFENTPVHAVLATPEPTSRATPTASSVLKTDIAWAVPAWRVMARIEDTSWRSPHVAEFYVIDSALLVIDVISLQTTAEPETFPDLTPPDRILSSDGRYFVRCTDNSDIRLYRTIDEQLLWEFESSDVNCYSIVWTTALPVMSFIIWHETEFATIFTWQEGDREPRAMYQSQSYGDLWPEWSPDGKRAVAMDDLDFVVIHTDGRQPFRFASRLYSDIWQLYWLNDTIFEAVRNGAWSSTHYYFDANTGRRFPFWNHDFGLSQPPAFSPDWRWRMTDNSFRRWTGEPYATPDYFVNSYELVDFLTGQSFKFVEGEQRYLRWLGWTDDSQMFHLIHCPATASAVSDPGLPFGFLALNPETREFTQLFDQAVFAEFSPDKQLAWVVFPAKRDDGALGLDGGIFDLADKTLVGRQFVSDRMLYANPAEGDLVPMSWSNDGVRLVFGDSAGNLTLLGADGAVQTLATNLPHDAETWPKNVHYAWSPDDAHLLAQYGEQAWIVRIP